MIVRLDVSHQSGLCRDHRKYESFIGESALVVFYADSNFMREVKIMQRIHRLRFEHRRIVQNS